MKVIVCDKCFNVPKITIINKNQIQLDCSICNSISSLDLDYFNRFITINESDDLFSMEKENKNIKKQNKTTMVKKNIEENKNIQNKKNEKKEKFSLKENLDEIFSKEEDNIDDIFGPSNSKEGDLFG